MTRCYDNASSRGKLSIQGFSAVAVFPRRLAAFTLIELLVVISILALLMTILAPSLKRARELTVRTVCQSGLHRCGTALANYVYDYRRYPNQRQSSVNTAELPGGGPYIEKLAYKVFEIPLAEEVGWEWDAVIWAGIDSGYVANADIPFNETVGKTLSCPKLPDLPDRNTFWPNGTGTCGYFGNTEQPDRYNWDLGYYYYGGVIRWSDAYPAYSPRRLSDPADWALMGDQITHDIRSGDVWSMAHSAGNRPEGGNMLFHDQHVEWYPWADGDNFRANNTFANGKIEYYWHRTVGVP